MKEGTLGELKKLSKKNLAIADTIAYGAHLLGALYEGMGQEEIGVLPDETWSRP